MTKEEQYIIDLYGEEWLRYSWSAGDVQQVMEDYASHVCEEKDKRIK